ncbi:MAG TPA: M48 family metallopeptidase, partial [Anaeromyxobacteraceae bacterium]|nr:M48 family metallopeptidase [Anaeromyxobacteraceae bacterium]
MTPARFEALAARFERFAAARPRLYRFTVGLLGAAGLGFVASWLVLAGGLLALVVVAMVLKPNAALLKIGIPLAILAWSLLRAMWVKFERPEGIVLSRDDAPAAWAELDRLRRLGKLPRIHRLLVDDRLNAAMAQTPRLGILGWPHNDVIVGMPLMLALGPETFRAVLAHELGHLSGRHGRMGARVYRVRATLGQAVAALAERKSRLTGLFRRFLDWYGPWFQAASFALARQQEREADRFSAAATDARTAADALVATTIAGWALDARYDPALRRRPAFEPAPPERHLAWMEETLRAAGGDPDQPDALARALEARAAAGDTHPSLAERLEALGQPPRVPPAPIRSAASVFLGPCASRVQAELETRWRADVGEAWTRAHEDGQRDLARLAELETSAGAAPLAADEACERVAIVERIRGATEALPFAMESAARHPDHPLARFQLGRLLLGRQDAAGLPHLEHAMSLDADATLPAARLIAGYYLSEGRTADAAPWIERARSIEAVQEAADAERAEVSATDAVEPHELEQENVERFAAPLRGHPRVKKAWLARKKLAHFPDQARVYVVGVKLKGTWYRLERSDTRAKLAQELANAIGLARVFVFVDGEGVRP